MILTWEIKEALLIVWGLGFVQGGVILWFSARKFYRKRLG